MVPGPSMTPHRGEVLLSVSSDKYQTQNFHSENGIPVLECRTLADHCLPPRLFAVLILWSFSEEEGNLL